MKFTPKQPPRHYEVGFEHKVTIADCGQLELDADEQVTLVTGDGAEYDVTRKSWGFYATPSLNGRLASFGLRGVLVKNRQGKLFVLLVERGQEEDFERYLADERLTPLCWLDTDQDCRRLEEALGAR